MKWGLIFAAIGFVCGEQGQDSLPPPPKPRHLRPDQEPLDLDYAVIFDIGSTGTRAYIHAFEWNPTDCFGKGAVKILMPGWSHKAKPGLAEVITTTLANKGNLTSAVEEYMRPLREFVGDVLRPEDLERTLYMSQATGGFRYLNEKERKAGVEEVRKQLQTWPGVFKPTWARVISGAEEGAMSWLALNQLARRFFEPFEHVALHPHIVASEKARAENPLPGFWFRDNWKAEAEGTANRRLKQRVGMIEMGGASAQVALEPPRDVRKSLLNEVHPMSLRNPKPVVKPHPRGDGFHLLSFCHETIALQIQSLDGFGRQAALQEFLKAHMSQHAAKINANKEFEVPCLPENARIPVIIADGDNSVVVSEEAAKNLTGNAVFARGMKNGQADSCKEAVNKFLSRSIVTKRDFKLDPAYRFYATENFYYFNEYVAKNSDRKFSPQDFYAKAVELCAEPTIELIRGKLHQDASEEKGQTACFGLIFLSEFLHTVVDVEEDQIIKAVTAVKDLDTGFALGSLITELPLMIRSLESDPNLYSRFFVQHGLVRDPEELGRD